MKTTPEIRIVINHQDFRCSLHLCHMSLLLCSCLDWKSELKVGSATGFRLDPDATSMPFDNLLANRKPNTVPGIFRAGMQAPENDKGVLCLLRCDANSIVRHRKDPLVCCRFRVYLNRGCFGTAKLDGVSNQVLKYLDQLRTIRHHHGKWTVPDHRATFLNCRIQIA